MRVLEENRYSNAAIWCERFAVFLVPYFLIVVLLYRFFKIETMQLFVLVAVGLILAIVSVVLGLRSIIELWSKGYRGGSHVVRGLLIAVVILLPFMYQAFLAVQFPLLNDVATDPFNPPQYLAATSFRTVRADEGMNPVRPYSPEHAQTVVTAYPSLQPRRYPASSERVYDAVQSIIQENEWPITGTSGVLEATPATEAEVQNTETAEEALEDNAPPPEDIEVEFVQRTLLFGFANDAVIRIGSEDQNTVVDMRVSSRWGEHDFGHNARLIEEFFSQLDEALLGIAGEG